MNAAEKELVAALRSGEYSQGRHVLRSNGHFCCLGVACDLFDPSAWKRTNNGYEHLLQHTVSLPPTVRAHLGWSTIGGLCSFSDRDKTQITLMGLNDDGFTFDQIADIIEAGLVQHYEQRIPSGAGTS